jgi:hypothetical protein
MIDENGSIVPVQESFVDNDTSSLYSLLTRVERKCNKQVNSVAFCFCFFIILFYKAVVDQLLLNLCIIALFIRDFPPILQAVLTNSDRKIISFV